MDETIKNVLYIQTFLSLYKLKDPQSLNLYSYTKNNPIMNVDPDGNFPAAIAVYFIPGIGEVALLATGAAILGGITYKAGSWLGQKAKYIYAGNQLVAVEKNGVMYYVHTNHRGDILALTDINGTQVATYKVKLQSVGVFFHPPLIVS